MLFITIARENRDETLKDVKYNGKMDIFFP